MSIAATVHCYSWVWASGEKEGFGFFLMILHIVIAWVMDVLKLVKRMMSEMVNNCLLLQEGGIVCSESDAGLGLLNM